MNVDRYMGMDECGYMKCIHGWKTILFCLEMAFVHVGIEEIHVKMIAMDVIHSFSNHVHLI
jgi:hypothetical protein